jgi:hypothetical protein
MAHSYKLSYLGGRDQKAHWTKVHVLPPQLVAGCDSTCLSLQLPKKYTNKD